MDNFEVLTGAGRIFRNLFFISLAALSISFFQKDKFPSRSDVLNQLYSEPEQTETMAGPINISKGGVIYNIKPLYNYEIYGMVVSYHLASAWWDYYHGQWKDALNFKDIGLIWGDNIKSGVYKDMGFKSGSWTLYAYSKTGKHGSVWSKFKNEAISNNHLLSNDARVSGAIMKAERGDQVYMKGYLSSYSHSGGTFNRGTSICRTDTGNGSCETVYVTDFKVLRKANVFWRLLFRLSKYAVFVSLILWFSVYYKKLDIQALDRQP